jgi:hypothetical protein
MPLELGMAMAIRGSPALVGAHEYLVLVPEEHYIHQPYISDLAGLDPQTHDGTPTRIVSEVLAWLLTAAEAPAELDPPEVVANYRRSRHRSKRSTTSGAVVSRLGPVSFRSRPG